MLVSIFLSVSVINGTLNNYSLDDLIKKLATYGIFGDETFLKKLFGFKNRQFSLEVGDEEFKIDLEKNNKLVLCQLDLAKMDIKYEQARKQQILERKQ